jgi:RNA polymerase sigma factor (sigma-70 family)
MKRTIIRGGSTMSEMADAASAEPTDAALVSASRSGDRTAFERLVLRYQPIADGYARHLLDNAEAVEDMVQEAFLKAYRALHTLQEPDRFAVWLKSILWRECRRWIESQVRRRSTLRAFGTESTEGAAADAGTAGAPLDRGDAAEDDDAGGPWLAELSCAVASLSAANRRALALFYILDEPQERIARFLAVPVGTVKRRLHDSRRSIAASLDGHELDHAQRRRVIADLQRLLATHAGPIPDVPPPESQDQP